ncbi:hypothetical protein HDU76_008236 [Blyttiomyces sp. JEL0837]|nr:hypothetical protein HDU76_008236 [Blyttiomyces sp. JEL0837]
MSSGLIGTSNADIFSKATPPNGNLSISAAVALAQKLAATSISDEPNHENEEHDFDLEIGDHEDVEQPSMRTLYLDPLNKEKLAAFVESRLREGQGESIIEIGIEDDGASMNLTELEFKSALSALSAAADKLGSDVTVLNQRRTLILPTSSSSLQGASEEEIAKTVGNAGSPVEDAAPAQLQDQADESSVLISSPYFYAHCLVRQRAGNVANLLELRIAVVGNVDAGKSTLLGVLTKGVLDDGRGRARVNLFRHKHEVESGRTSSVGLEIMGFNSKGETLTTAMLGKTKLNWDDICVSASKVLSFIDLAGHEKYLKTTVFGLSGCAPDFVQLLADTYFLRKIGSNAGIIGMTKEHLGLALALQVPVYIVVTKIDMCPKNVLESTLKQLTKILKSSGCRKIPMFIKTPGDVLMTAGHFVSERICPIFLVSNLTGEGLDLLKMFLNVLHANSLGRYNVDSPVEYQITDTFSVPGVGTVVSGTVMGGIVHVGDSLLLGPDSTGQFHPTIVKSIQRKRVNVPCASAGQSASFALKKVKRSTIRKGMVMLSKSADAKAVYEFEAEILVLYHSTTIGAKYQAMLHCGCVRQTAKIIGMDKQVLRTGDRALVQFRFIQHPEYMKVGTRLLFREGLFAVFPILRSF